MRHAPGFSSASLTSEHDAAAEPHDAECSDPLRNARSQKTGARHAYAGNEMTAHGFRAMASTLLNESGKWNPDAIERALAHQATDVVRGAYHRGTH